MSIILSFVQIVIKLVQTVTGAFISYGRSVYTSLDKTILK